MAQPGGLPVRRLLRRSDFQALKTKGLRFSTQSFVVQVIDFPEEKGLAVGFTTSGALGNAVKRNRARRRLKATFDAAVRLNPHAAFLPGHTGKMLAIIGKMPIFDIAWPYLLKDMKKALQDAGVAC